MVQKTFAIIKPTAVADKQAGHIIAMIEDHGFTVTGMKRIQMAPAQAETFYAIHKERPFFGELVSMMTSGPVVVMVLEKNDAVQAWRDLMGTTDPAKSAEGTVRKRFGKSIGDNATHGSDSEENARIEIKQFFPELA